jgi:hypothetical protein
MLLKLKYYQSFLSLFFMLAVAQAQVNIGGQPKSFKNSSLLLKIEAQGQSILLPSLDNVLEQARADSIAKKNCTNCENNYYGRGLDVSIDIKRQGQLETLEDGSKLWLLKVTSPTAYGLQFYFDKYKVPEGASLYLFNENKSMVLGGFTSDNNPKDKNKAIQFGTQYIGGGTVFIEYHEPAWAHFEGEVSITKAIHIFEDIFLESGGPWGTSLDCNINVSCPEGIGWEKEINSVALVLAYNADDELTGWCSGALINNTSEDGQALFLTAKHCIDPTQFNVSPLDLPLFDHSTWLFLFNHQTSSCESDGSEVSNYTAESVYGSILLAEDGLGSPTSDYLLLDLVTSEFVLSYYGACYAGWSLSSTHQGPFAGIHHPKGDVKKISIANSIDDFSDTHWEVDWDQDKGTTQKGSSGSPLFNNNHQIIGQVHYGKKPTGADDCHPDKITGYGKITKSWAEGGFSYWLDPDNTGQTSVDTYCAQEISTTGGGTGGTGGGGPGTGDNPDGNSGAGNSGGIFGGQDWDHSYLTGLLTVNFNINGKRDRLINVCVGDDIILSAANELGDIVNELGHNYRFYLKRYIKSKYFCSNIDNKHNAYFHTNDLVSNCTYYFASLFISVTQCDENLNPIGEENTKWHYFTENEELFWYPNTGISSVNLNDCLSSTDVNFLSGHTYRLMIASLSNFGDWVEQTKYIRFSHDELDVNGTNPSGNLYGNDITIQNSTITEPIEVVASNSIAISSGSDLSAGDYYIDEMMNCESFHGEMRLAVNDVVAQDTIFIRDHEETPIKREIGKPEKSLFTVYPNPTKGEFNLRIDGHVDERVALELTDLLGKVILKETGNKSNYTFNLSAYPKGVYLLKVKIGNEVAVEKIIHQ